MKAQITIVSALTALLAMPAFADSTAMVAMAESDAHVSFLADDLGRPLYFFMTEEPNGATEAALDSCTSEDCLKAWPLLTTNGAPKAGAKVIALLLGTTNYRGQAVVTYNGRPLHYFVQDVDEDLFGFGNPQGDNYKSFGGQWHLMQASGEPAE